MKIIAVCLYIFIFFSILGYYLRISEIEEPHTAKIDALYKAFNPQIVRIADKMTYDMAENSIELVEHGIPTFFNIVSIAVDSLTRCIRYSLYKSAKIFEKAIKIRCKQKIEKKVDF